MTREYRVAWRRKGFRRTKYRTYKSESAARRFMLLFGAEPWLYNPKKEPDAMWCCSGYEVRVRGAHGARVPREDARRGPGAGVRQARIARGGGMGGERMTDWRPISTAPKDGTQVLVCCNAPGATVFRNASDGAWGLFVQVAAWWADEDDEDGGEWVVYCSIPSEPRLHFEPTHWAELPAPPGESQREER